MSYPSKPSIQTSYTAVEQALGDGALPGQELDVDFANLKQAIDTLNDFVRGITRSDGRLGNNTVTRDTLATDILLGLEPPGAWEAGKDYRPPNTVFEDNRFYLALTEHTSDNFANDLAAGRWLLLADFSIGDPVPLGRQVNTTGLATGGGDLTENRTIDVPAASQAEAEAGTINDKAMTPLRVAQALAVLQRALSSQAQAEAGTNNDTVMTPLRVAQALAAVRAFASQAQAEAGTNNDTVMTPLRTHQAIDERAPGLLSQEQVEDDESTVEGLVSGQRLAQAVAAHGASTLQAIEQLEPGEEIRSRDDNTYERSGTSSSWSTLHEFRFAQFGEIRVAFEHRAVLVSVGQGEINAEARVRLWRNGSTSTVETFSTTSETFVARAVDVEVKPGDRVWIEHRGSFVEGGMDPSSRTDSRTRNMRFQTDGQSLWPGAEARLENPDPE